MSTDQVDPHTHTQGVGGTVPGENDDGVMVPRAPGNTGGRGTAPHEVLDVESTKTCFGNVLNLDAESDHT